MIEIRRIENITIREIPADVFHFRDISVTTTVTTSRYRPATYITVVPITVPVCCAQELRVRAPILMLPLLTQMPRYARYAMRERALCAIKRCDKSALLRRFICRVAMPTAFYHPT